MGEEVEKQQEELAGGSHVIPTSNDDFSFSLVNDYLDSRREQARGYLSYIVLAS